MYLQINSDDITTSIKKKPEVSMYYFLKQLHLDFHFQPVGITNYYYNLREVSKRFDLPVGKFCVIPSTYNSGEVGEFLIRVFVEKSWGSSDKSERMSFRLSSRVRSLLIHKGSKHSPGISPKISPRPSPKSHPKSSSSTPMKYVSLNAQHLLVDLPSDNQNMANIRKRLTKSLNFCQSIDEEWEVLQRVVKIMKSKQNDDIIKEEN